MKSAKEMFEELGYTTRKEEFKNDEMFSITFANYAKGDWVEIKKERIEVVKDRTKGYLDIPTLQAINKQVEELKWKVEE